MNRDRLLAEREQAAHQVQAVQADFDAIVESTELVPTDDEHDPDGATIAFERAMIAFHLDQARAQVEALDAAIERLAAGTYGVCTTCGAQIAPVRLETLPATSVCMACAGH